MKTGETTGFFQQLLKPNVLVILTVAAAGLVACSHRTWADQSPQEVNCSWTGVKCCFTNLCECCPRDGKGAGKANDERHCRLIRVTPEDLPISGYLASRDCLLRMGPWSTDGIRACQGSLLWIELRDVEDLCDIEYSYLQCGGGEPYLVPVRDQVEPAHRTSWGSLKMMYR